MLLYTAIFNGALVISSNVGNGSGIFGGVTAVSIVQRSVLDPIARSIKVVNPSKELDFSLT